MIAYWCALPDQTLGVRVKGRPIEGSNITVRFLDRREPAHEVVEEIVQECEDGTTLCRIKRKTT